MSIQSGLSEMQVPGPMLAFGFFWAGSASDGQALAKWWYCMSRSRSCKGRLRRADESKCSLASHYGYTVRWCSMYIHRAFGLLVDVPHVVPIFLSPSLTTHTLTHSLHPLTPLILLILFQIGRDSNRLLWSQINCLAFSLIDLPSLLFS